MGLQPDHEPLGHDASRPGEGSLLVVASLGVYALPLLAIAAIGVLLSTVTRNSARRGGRRADDRAADAADRHPAGHRGDRAVPADDAVRRVAGLPADAHRLGADHPRRLGLARSTPPSRSRAPTWCSCAATSPAASGPRTVRCGAVRRAHPRAPRRRGGPSASPSIRCAARLSSHTSIRRRTPRGRRSALAGRAGA